MNFVRYEQLTPVLQRVPKHNTNVLILLPIAILNDIIIAGSRLGLDGF